METKVYKEYSNCLGRDMEFKVYGHGGKPVLVVPSQNGRYFDFENFGMVDVCAPEIEAGKLQLFSFDTLMRRPGRMNGEIPAAGWRCTKSGSIM